MTTAPIETKVSLPALVVGISWSVVAALYMLAKAYGFEPTADQNTAIIGLGAALGYAAQTIVAYLAPHTSRPDLDPEDVTTAVAGSAELAQPVAASEPAARTAGPDYYFRGTGPGETLYPVDESHPDETGR